MSAFVDFSAVIPVEQFEAEDDEEKRRVSRLVNDAHGFIATFTWCGGVRETYVGDAVGGVIGIFLLRIDRARPDVDEWLWVVVGDLPPAYLVTDDAPTPGAALDAYSREMTRWVDAVKQGRPLDDVIPIAAEPTREHAEMLESRLRSLAAELRPYLA